MKTAYISEEKGRVKDVKTYIFYPDHGGCYKTYIREVDGHLALFFHDLTHSDGQVQFFGIENLTQEGKTRADKRPYHYLLDFARRDYHLEFLDVTQHGLKTRL